MWVTPCHEDSFFFFWLVTFSHFHTWGRQACPVPTDYSILTDLAIRVQQVLEEALRESYAEEVDVNAESESDQTAAAPEIGGALSTALAGSSSAHAADEPGSSSATFAEEAEDVRRKPGVVDEISQTDPGGSALDLCLLCATALRPSTSSVTTQTDVVLVEAERETGEVDQLSADSDDFYASIGRSSTPVQISSSLFTPQVHRTDLDTSGDTDSEALNTTDVEMTELELDVKMGYCDTPQFTRNKRKNRLPEKFTRRRSMVIRKTFCKSAFRPFPFASRSAISLTFLFRVGWLVGKK